MILAAQESVPEEWDEYTFVQAIGNGNPSPTVANDLTDVVLELVTWEFASDE